MSKIRVFFKFSIILNALNIYAKYAKMFNFTDIHFL